MSGVQSRLNVVDVPEDELRETLRPEIPSLVKLLEHNNRHIPPTAASLLEKVTGYGEWHPGSSYMLLICLKASFERH